ncbi:hypothetical protein SY88_20830 [Clostridiales bacterium PH28_bin88]|nr:hypothetical protein SY88_20830 [Clostridiales bacterium PH28_bin88]
MKPLSRWVALVLLVVTGLTGCGVPGGGDQAAPAKTGRVRLVATFYPIAYFAREVGSDRVEVVTLVPTGVEPHEWEPSPRQLLSLRETDVFVYNGAGLEPWASRMVEGANNQRLVVIETSDGLELLPADPHVWLDPVLAQGQVARIVEGLIAADPQGEPVYRANGEALTRRLQELDEKYRQALAGSEGAKIFTSHSAFSYLARRYSLRQVPVMGLSPEAEPSPAQMAQLVRLAREEGAKYIFFESLTSPRLAETLAGEVGAETLVLNPIEGLTPDEVSRGEDYFTLMEQNLANLLKAVEQKP